MNIFFIAPPEGETIVLPEDESIHCIRVLRMKAGDAIRLVDGKGRFYNAVIIRAKDKACEAKITGQPETIARRPYSIHLAVAPTKSSDRFEWMLEKVTELGCERITPLICEHSERVKVNRARLEKVLVAAMKQSLQAWLPQLDEPMDFNKFITSPWTGQRFLCSAEGMPLNNQYESGHSVILVVGPEGDFSPQELAAADAQVFLPCSLGNTRLRTETAGLAACLSVHVLNR